MIARLFLAFWLLCSLVACQSMLAASTAISPPAPPSQTPAPTETATPFVTSTARPTPTASPAELRRRGGPICEHAFSVAVENGTLIPPFGILKKETYAQSPSWEPEQPLPHLGSLSASEVQTLFCISETRSQTGTYSDGSAAYQLLWEVRVVSWPGGKVIQSHTFIGPPPKTGSPAAVSAAEASPYDQFAGWVFHQVRHPDFLYTEDAITALAIAPDGNVVAFGTSLAHEIVDRDFQARIYLFDPSNIQTDLGTNAYSTVLEGHQGMVTSLAFSPDGNVLASSGHDFFIKFWDVKTGKLLGQVNTATDTPNALVFSPDGNRLTAATNLQILFIEPTSRQIERIIPEASAVDLAFSPDGRRLYVRATGKIKVIDTVVGRRILTFPDTSTLIPTLTLDSEGNVQGMSYEIPHAVDGFALSADGVALFTYSMDRSSVPSAEGENIRFARWDATSGRYLEEIQLGTGEAPFLSPGRIQTITLAADSSRMASGQANTVLLWDTRTWQVVRELVGHTDAIEEVLFTPDSTSLLSAARDGTIRVWSLQE
jgi:WD40 repeat protein